MWEIKQRTRECAEESHTSEFCSSNKNIMTLYKKVYDAAELRIAKEQIIS